MRTNEQLIQELVSLGYIKNSRIADAMRSVLREKFVPEEYIDRAYENEALPIGYEQTTSQPLVVAHMLELLSLRTGDTVLEIGTGSGWQTCLLAYLTGSDTSDTEDALQNVISIERVHELHEKAKEKISDSGFEKKVFLMEADGLRGCEERAPFDRIIAGAEVKDIPETWKEQLKIGGRMVLPVRENIVLMEKTGKNEFISKEYFGFHFVPLVTG